MALGKDGNSNNSPSIKPYDASNSFVKKIANRVTGLIGWRSNSYENAEDYNHEDLPNTSLTDDEPTSPNPKRIKLLHNAEPRNCPAKSATEDSCNIIPPVNDLNVAGPSFKSKCLVASTPAANYCVKNSSLHSGNVSDYLDSSAPSNISSPLPSCSTTQRHNITIPGVHLKDMSSIATYDMNKSLSETSTMMSKRRPSFNAEVFSASNKRLSLSVCESRNRSCLSPFYSARTMYGGASALLPYSSQSGAKLRSESASNLNVFSAKNQITIQPVPSPHKGGSNDQETMSAAARKILDTLERYCSPIKDAKRIPMNESSKCEDDRTYTPRGIKRKLPSLSQITPSTTDLLRIKRQEKMQDSILNARQAVSNVPEPSTSVVADIDSSSDSADLDYTVFNDETKRRDDVQQNTNRKEESKYDERPIQPAIALKSSSNSVLSLGNLPRYEITETFTFSKPLTLENFDKTVDDDSEDASAKKSAPAGSSGVGRTIQNFSGSEQRPSLSATATVASKLPAMARTNASGESLSFISTQSSSPFAASRRRNNSNGGNETSAAKSTTSTNPLLASKPNITSNTSLNKFISPVSKLSSGKWTCKKCFLESSNQQCSSCASSKPEQHESEKNTKSSDSSASRSEDKFSPSIVAAGTTSLDGASKTTNVKSTNNKLVVNNVAIGSGFNTFNDLDRKKCGTGDDHGLSSTKLVTNIKDDSAPASADSKKTDTAEQSQSNDLWKNLQKRTDEWTCSTCLVKNKKTSATCVACETPNENAPQAAAADQDKTAATTKPKFTFGIPATDAGPVKFGAVDAAKPVLGFGFGNTVATTNTTAQFSFGSTTTVANADTNATPSYTFGINKLDSSTNMFGSSGGAFAGDATTNNTNVDKSGSTSSQKTFEMTAFNDASATTNNKKISNPFAKSEANSSASGMDNSASGATNSPKFSLLQKNTIRENGEAIQSPSTVISNDIASSGIMNSPMKKKPSTSGFPLPTSIFGKDTATVTSSPNTFATPNGGLLNNTTNEFKLPSAASSSMTTNSSAAPLQTGNLFASAGFSSSAPASSTLSNSKPNEVPSFGSATANTSQSIGIGSLNSNPFASSGQPVIFGNTTTMGKKDDKTNLALTADANKTNATASGSLFPMVNNNTTSNITNSVFGSTSPANNSIFGNFNSAGGNSTDSTIGKNTIAEPAAAATPSLNFNNPAPSANAPFRFSALTGIASNAANTPSQQQPNNNQTNSGGFTFNGPSKLDNSMMSPPKFGQGAFGTSSSTNATTFGSATNTGASTFTFGASSGTGQADSNAAPFSSALKTGSLDTMLKAPATPAFGSTVFGGDTVKKSGGFNFTPANPMTTPTINSFSGFASTINDSQDQNRLNNLNAAASATPFVFSGGASNPSIPTHNFSTTVPTAFNFNSSATPNSLPQFTATPQPASATGAPGRKIKKAVRRTAK